MATLVVGVAGGLALAGPAQAAPEPIIDAPGASSGEAPATTEPVLTTQVPLPPDPVPPTTPVSDDPARPADEPVLSTQVPLPPDPLPETETSTLVINGSATVGEPDDSSDTGSGTTTATSVPSLVINGPATVGPQTTPPTTQPAINGPATVGPSTPPTTQPAIVPAVNEVGGSVYFDDNRNGVDDGAATDRRAPGVGVFVIWDGADGQAGTADDRKYETVTDADGAYSMSGLPDGGYTIALNPATLPDESTVLVDPDGGLADATSVVWLAGGTVDRSQSFGLGARPQPTVEAVVVIDDAPTPIVLGDSGVAPAASGARNDAGDVTGADPLAQVLPATGQSEVTWTFTIASILLVVGLALLGVRRRDGHTVEG